MENLCIATAQFEHKNGDKKYNISIIDKLAGQAAEAGAAVIAFHECSITGYTFARKLSEANMLELAELIPGGESIEKITAIADKYNIVILAGLFEKTIDEELY